MSAICDPCGQTFAELDFSADVIDLLKMKAGRSYQFQVEVTDEYGEQVNITSDAFEMSILNSIGVEVENLQVGSGFTIIAPNILQGVITSLTTGAAGTYTHTIVWNIAASGASPLLAQGKITVKV